MNRARPSKERRKNPGIYKEEGGIPGESDASAFKQWHEVVRHEAVVLRVRVCSLLLVVSRSRSRSTSGKRGRRVERGRRAGAVGAGGIHESTNPLPQHLMRVQRVCVSQSRRTVDCAIRPRVALEWIRGFLDSVIIGLGIQESRNPRIHESTQTSPRRISGEFFIRGSGLHFISF